MPEDDDDEPSLLKAVSRGRKQVGAKYPNQSFTGWIPPESPVNKSTLLSGIEGKRVRITGRIEVYKGKPEIRINAASQLEVE